MTATAVSLGPLELASPLIAASGTVGSVAEWAPVGAPAAYGAAVAKSVSLHPWAGNPPPRLAPAGVGMLNAIGIQNPGIAGWADAAGDLAALGVPVWGSAVGEAPGEFGIVAKGLAATGVAAVEVNLSCPNVDGALFALDPASAAEVVREVRAAVDVPIGAKLSPNAADIVAVASAVREAGADWVILTNTAWGFGVDIETGRPILSRGVGGYSGPPLKPIALRCVWEVHRALPDLPIIGCGGVRSGADVVEYLMAGARAVALGTVHFAEPRAGRRVLRELVDWCAEHEVARVADLLGAAHRWA